MDNAPVSGLVSVIMPTYNAQRTVDRAIDSVVAQTHGNWELICIDDASQDRTRERLDARARELGQRMKVQHLPDNGGPARARNHGLAASRGVWIAVLDADDAWHPDRLATLLAEANKTGADVLCDNLMGYDDHSEKATEPLFLGLPPSLDIPVAVAAEYRGRYNLGYLKPLVRRGFVEAKAIRYDEALRTGEDLLFMLECLAGGALGRCLDWPGYIYTTPVGHASRRPSRSTSTTPRDRDLERGLARFLSANIVHVSLTDTDAVRERMGYLSSVAEFAQFRHARLQQDWPTAFRLLRKRDVRCHFIRSILGRRWSSIRAMHCGRQ